MTSSLRLVAVMIITALASAGCLDFSPPPTTDATPTRTPTATWTPEPTATVATATPTSTSTPEATLTPTETPFNPFGTGAGTSGTAGSNGGFLGGLFPPGALATPAVGLGTPFPTPGTNGAGVSLPPLPPTVGQGEFTSSGPQVLPTPTQTPVSWSCNGDERITFVPDVVTVGQNVLITVTSADVHGYTLLQVVGERGLDSIGMGRGGPGYYWQWSRLMDKPGLFKFEFYAGPRVESRCVTGEVRVIVGGAPPTPTPVPAQIPTATPTRTPRPDH